MNEENNKRLGLLIFALARGDVSVLEDIYLLMVKILYAIGNIYFNQKADIEDAIQDFLILLYEKAGKFKHNKNACAWVIKLYQNLIYRKLENRRREEKYLSSQMQLQELAGQEDSSVYIENHIFFKEVLGKLNEYERELIIYRYICKCSIKEVADIMRKPKSTVESQLKKLEEFIKKL